MKTLNEIINQEYVFLNDWFEKEDVLLDFKEERYDWDTGEVEFVNKVDENVNILFASYGNANYTGSAWVLFEKDGDLYEVEGSHCSCYGLEGQWIPDEVITEELENRLLNGTFGEDDWSENNFKEELCKFLGVEFKLNYKRGW